MVKTDKEIEGAVNPAWNPFRLQPVEIVGLKQETSDVKTYNLRLADRGSFRFRPGQFNMVSVIGIGEAAISMSSDPDGLEVIERGTWQHTVRRVGNVTKALDRLQVGDRFFIRGPYGNGWPPRPCTPHSSGQAEGLDAEEGTRPLQQAGAGRDLAVIAGGVGLAPLRPVVYRRLANKTGRLEILYGARTPEDMPFRDEFRTWEQNGARLMLTVDKIAGGAAWPYRVGLAPALIKEMEILPGQGQVFVCGPEVMMKFVVRELTKRGWPPEEIFISLERRMECGQKTCGRCQVDAVYVCQDGPVFSYAVVKELLGVDI
jgi:NAD(P)H-flavin reductase